MKKLLLTLIAIIVGVYCSHAETIKITPETLKAYNSSTSYATNDFEFKAGGYTFKAGQVNPSTGQIKVNANANSGAHFYNTTSIPNIKSIKLTASASTLGTWYMAVGTSQINSAATTSNIAGTKNGSTVTFTVPDDTDASFFRINLTTKGSGTVKFSSIEIEYASNDTRTETTLSFDNEVVGYTIGGAFAAPALTVDPIEATSAVVYTSSNPEVATVDDNGNVTIVATGTSSTTITASIPDDNETYKAEPASYTIKVIDPNVLDATFDFVNESYGLERNPTDYTESGTLTSGDVSLELSKTTGNGFRLWSDGLRVYKGKVAIKVVAPGNVTAIKIEYVAAFGTPKIGETQFIQDTDAKTYSWTGSEENPTINIAPTDNKAIKTLYIEYVKSNKEESGLSFGETTSFTVDLGSEFTAPTLINDKGIEVVYTSSDEEVATVNADGKVTLVGAGTTTITAAPNDTDKYYGSTSYTLTVVKAAKNVLEVYEVGEGIDTKIGFDLTVTYVNGSNIYATDGTTATLIFTQGYKDCPTFEVGDVIPAGWTAQYSPFNNLPEIKPISGLVKGEKKVEVTYNTVEAVSLENVNEIVILNNVNFEEATPAGATSSKDKVSFDGKVGETVYTFRNNFAGVPSVEAGVYNVTLAVARYYDNIQLYPIEYDLIISHADINSYELKEFNEGDAAVIIYGVHADADLYYRINKKSSGITAMAIDHKANGFTKHESPEPDSNGKKMYTIPVDNTMKSVDVYTYHEASATKGKGQTINSKGEVTGVDDVIADGDGGEVEYYNLQGVRVENPAKGLYIRKQGNKAEKVYVK